MKPVKQSKLYLADGIHNGNCLAAAFASLLEVPLWMVPPWDDMFGRGFEFEGRLKEWLSRFFKAELVEVYFDEEEERRQFDWSSLPEFYIACGRSARGVQHAVIHSAGKMVHDPHPSDSGIGSVQKVMYLKPLAEPVT